MAKDEARILPLSQTESGSATVVVPQAPGPVTARWARGRRNLKFSIRLTASAQRRPGRLGQPGGPAVTVTVGDSESDSLASVSPGCDSEYRSCTDK